MWAIRILSGPQAGQIFPLKPGTNKIGRAPSCDIQLASNGISKEHAQLYATEDKLIATDLDSRNGTFVNGVRIQNQRLTVGDKLVLHELVADIIEVPEAVAEVLRRNPSSVAQLQAQLQGHSRAPGRGPRPPGPLTSAGRDHDHASRSAHEEPAAAATPARRAGLAGLWDGFIEYLDRVAMPGFYHFAQMVEYRRVLIAMVTVYVFLVTTIATLPTMSLIKTTVQEESQRRARTIARNLAALNRQAIIDKNEIAIVTRGAEIEDGVAAALIVNARDGSILAPANRRGSSPDQAFTAKVRRSDKEMVERISASMVGASVPIVAYNSDLRDASPVAYAVILYDVGAIATQSGRVYGLYFNILAIACTLGLLLAFLLIRLVEHPVAELNARLDDALREGRDDLRTPYHYPGLKLLASNINSLLARMGMNMGADGARHAVAEIDRDGEAANLITLIPAAAMAINAIDERIIAANPAFERLVGGSGQSLGGRAITEIPDSSLQLHLRELLPRARSMPGQAVAGEIPFSGEAHAIRVQTVTGSGGEAAYFVIVIVRSGEEAA